MAKSESVVIEQVMGLINRVEDEARREAFDNAAEALKELLGLPITLSVLQKTKVGVKAAKLRSHSNAALSAVAGECVKAWKKVAEDSGAVARTTPSASASLGASSSTNSTASASSMVSPTSVAAAVVVAASGNGVAPGPAVVMLSPAAAAATSSLASSSPPPAAGAGSAVKSMPAVRLSVARQRVKDMLKKILSEVVTAHFNSEAGAKECAAIFGSVQSVAVIGQRCDVMACEVEGSLYTALGGYNPDKPAEPYLDQFKTLAFNLKRNVPLTLNIYYGVIATEGLARMSSQELISDEAKVQAEEARKAHLEASQLDWGQKNKAKVLASAGLTVGEGTLSCPKCKGKNTEYTQKQTRSADEPMTTFGLCNDCGSRWKFC